LILRLLNVRVTGILLCEHAKKGKVKIVKSGAGPLLGWGGRGGGISKKRNTAGGPNEGNNIRPPPKNTSGHSESGRATGKGGYTSCSENSAVQAKKKKKGGEVYHPDWEIKKRG